jgi:hypothetical protein
VEASQEPGRAIGAADRLRGLMPGAGHLVHMPSHIYLRVGRYDESVTANVRAAEADRAYFKEGMPSPIYRGMYYPHNLDFIWHAASMDGRSAETLKAARNFAGEAPLEMVRQMSDMETAPVAPLFALARFGRWEEILREPAPPADLPYWRGAWHYARGLAFAATGRPGEAQRELAALQTVRDGVPAERTLAGFFKTREMLTLAVEVLSGELAARRREWDAAVRHLAEAARIQDGHWFTEPPPWYFPVRQSLGAILVSAGRSAEAEVRLSRGPAPEPRERLVAVWPRAGAPRPGEDGGGRHHRRALPPRLGPLRRHADRVALLARRYLRRRRSRG